MGVLGSKIKQVSVDMTELDFTAEQTGTSIDVLSEMANQFTDGGNLASMLSPFKLIINWV
jgi:hypothetical protein